MLENLKRTLGLTDASVADVNAEKVEKLTAELSEMTAKLDESNKVNEALTAQVVELVNKVGAAEAALAEMKQAQEDAILKAEQAKQDMRMSKLKSIVGDEKAMSLFNATKDMDDTNFEAVVGAVAATYDAENKSPLFSEVGVAAEVDAASVTEKSALQKALEEKYSASK